MSDRFPLSSDMENEISRPEPPQPTGDIVRVTLHYKDGSTLTCRPDSPPAPDPEPETPAGDEWPFDHVVTAERPSHDIVIPGPTRGLEFDLRFTLGAEPEHQRIQVLGCAGTEPGKLWKNRDLPILLILADRTLWVLRHGMDMDHQDKARNQVRWPMLAGETASILAGFDLPNGNIWVSNLSGGPKLEINTAPQRPYEGDLIVRFGEPEVDGKTGPSPEETRYEGVIRRLA